MSRAIELANKAIELAPEQADVWTTRGAAQYRAENFREAVSSLTRSTELNGKRAGSPRPVDLALLAKAHHRLGDEAKAREWLVLLRERMKDNRWNTDPEATAFHR